MTAWGQINAHLLHWIQSSGSHTGIWSPMLRFSNRDVPTGQVPSAGKAETGSRSPFPSISTEVIRRTKAGAFSGTVVGRGEPVTSSGSATRWRFDRAASTAAKLRFRTSLPLRAYVFSIAVLISPIAFSFGITFVIAKKHAWRIV